MPPDQVAALVDRIYRGQTSLFDERHLALLHDPGVATVTRFFPTFTIVGWIAQRPTIPADGRRPSAPP